MAAVSASVGPLNGMWSASKPALPLIQDGKLVALAVSSTRRASALPNVPTTTEAGMKDSAYEFWVGMFAPAKTPPDIVAKLAAETQKALETPSVRDRYAKLGVEPMRMTPEEFAAYFRHDVEETAKLVKAAKIPTQERN